MKTIKSHVIRGRMELQQSHGGTKKETSVSSIKMENGGIITTMENGIKKIFENFSSYCQKKEFMSLYIVRSEFWRKMMELVAKEIL